MSHGVAAHETGLVRAIRLSDALLAALNTADDLAPLERALGVVIGQPEDVQIVDAAVLDEMPLPQFLVMAYGVDEVALAKTEKLNNLKAASYALIRSGAFAGAAVTLQDSADATLVATVQEPDAAKASLTPLQADSAQGAITDPPTPKPKSDARVGGMVATFVLLFLFALVGVMIWVAG